LEVVSALVVAAVVSFAFGVPSGKATTAQTRSVCGVAGGVATWSPDGKRIAFIGGAGSRHAICVGYADGEHARPLRYTVCRRRCRLPLISFSGQLDWVRPRLLLYLDNFQIFKLQIGQRPQLLGKVQGRIDTFAVDARGDRVALGSSVRKTRWLGGDGRPVSADWSPDSRQLLVTDPSTGYPNCALLWRVPANGTKPQRIRNCS